LTFINLICFYEADKVIALFPMTRQVAVTYCDDLTKCEQFDMIICNCAL
jgi:hypothetical protein